MGAGGIMLLSGSFPASALATAATTKITILHTNDVHSRIEPFPNDGGRYAGLGGAARRAALIERIRALEPNVLLFDSGDMFQGTPYFNQFGGELEFKLMSRMGYNAATIGNHDFDAGIDGLVNQLKHANFPLISSNYEVADTPLNSNVYTSKIFNIAGIRIGVFGLGIELAGLVPKSLYGDVRYVDPVGVANATALHLRKERNCDYVVCLSHLGYEYSGSQISDRKLASITRHVDLILGGHTHTLLDEPVIVKNEAGQNVLINQVGWAGIALGRIDVYFRPGKKGVAFASRNMFINS